MEEQGLVIGTFVREAMVAMIRDGTIKDVTTVAALGLIDLMRAR